MSVRPAAAVADLVEEYVRETFAFTPALAANLGFHEYDGQVTDFRPASLQRRVSTLRALENKAEAVPATAAPEAFEHALLLRSIRAEAFRWESYQEHVRNPLLYTLAGNVTLYAKRSYAPLPDRVRALTRHLQAVPDMLATAAANLRRDLSAPLVEVATQQAAGHVRYLRDEVTAFIERTSDPDIQRAATAARQAAADAWSHYGEDLRARSTDAANFSIGRPLFEGLLQSNELVTEPVEVLRRIAEADLARNAEAVKEVAGRLRLDVTEAFASMAERHPTAERLIADTADLLEEIRTFIVERDLISIPSEVRCLVRPSPPFARAAFAMMDTAGAFETKADESYYYVTPVEPDWSAEQQESWLRRFNYSTLKDVSIHEAYPGHYVHLLHVRHARSRLGKIVRSTACTEGWAHYCEQMMVEEGYGAGDPMLQLAQLGEALLRDCRFLIALGMHAGEMTVEEATELLMSTAFYEAHPARKEAVRGTYDPMFLNYTLGKLMWLKLREDYRRERGGSFSLKAFHDQALSWGIAPIPLLRTVLLREPGTKAL
jgi:uncharacterized protein (DUF885 family)